MRREVKFRLILICLLLGLSIFFLIPPSKRIKLGLDLKGGVHLLYQVDQEKLKGKELSSQQIRDVVARAIEIIRNRVDQFGVGEPVIQRQGDDKIIVQLPGMEDPERAKRIIGKTALLEFRLVREEGLADAIADKKKIPKGYELLKDEEGNFYLVKKEPELTGKYLKKARAVLSAGGLLQGPGVDLEFDSEGARIFSRVTGSNVNRRLAIVLDEVVKSAPQIREHIPLGKAQISGGRMTYEEASDLAIVLRAGALPTSIKLVEERTIGPSLGQDSIKAGIIAAVIGFFLVVFFMIIYYKVSGLIAIIGLIANIIMLLGAMGALQATLTLPGIAGIILTIGMSVDANILIFERIREELRITNKVRASIDAGYKKAFKTILDANLTTIVAAIILYFWGSGPIRGFAVTLSIGVILSLFTAVTLTKVLFDLRKEVTYLSI